MRFSITMAVTLATLWASALFSQEYREESALPVGEVAIAATWNDLDQVERDKITLRNLHGLVRAIHKYHDVHGTFPPAEIPNLKLPPEKRLSGFVLLLPYLGEATYLWQGKEGRKIFDRQFAESTKKLYRSIDLSQAWDDPANLEAAKTLVPIFLLPGVKMLRDDKGLALSHVAFVRGSNGNDDGVFTSEPRRINEISDGTASTLAIGQVNRDFGPWIAAGSSTSRFLHTEDVDSNAISFGGSIDAGCFFVNCDSYPYFLDLTKTTADSLRALSTAAGGEIILNTKLARFNGLKAWAERHNQ